MMPSHGRTKVRPWRTSPGSSTRVSPNSNAPAFPARAEPPRPATAIGEISGVPERTAGLLREGAIRVLKASKTRMADDAASAEVRLQLSVALGDTKEGRRAVRVVVRLLSADGRALGTPVEEFKTTLSEPVDDEQWRVLGEGAVYKVLGDLTPPPTRRPSLRFERTLAEPATRHAQTTAEPEMEHTGGPIVLRLDRGERLSTSTLPDHPAGTP